MYDIKKIRSEFPMLDGKSMQGHPLVYLDNAATTFKPNCVIEAIENYYKNENANSHRGDYDLTYNIDKKIAKVREDIANFINCEPNEVVFTSGDTMSLNLVAWGYGAKYLKKGDEIVLSEAEHSSNLLPWFKIAELTGAVIKYIPLDNKGIVTVENAAKVINSHTKIVSLAHITNVLAYEIDVKSIVKLAHDVGAIFVCDGAQSVPHLKTDFKDLDIDILTFSAHKMCGPTGIGALIGKYDLLCKMDPFLSGGGMNETYTKECQVTLINPPSKFEAGTLNIAGILGFGAAVNYLKSIGMEGIHNHDVELFDYAIEKLKKLDDVILYNADARNGIITFNKKDVFCQDEATLLNSKGVAIRSGLHCSKILVDFLKTPGTCRMSTYLYTSKEDIDAFVEAVASKGDFLDAFFN